MSLYRRSGTTQWWCRFTIGGRKIRCTTGTAERILAEEFEHELRKRHWRETRLGQKHYTWKQATERWLRERSTKRSIERDRQIVAEYAELGTVALADFSRDMLDEVREARERKEHPKTRKRITIAAVNREMALLRSILNAAAGDWGWITAAPKVPMKKVEPADPRWLTRAQFETLVAKLPDHTKELARFAVSTGLRRSNITGLTWDRVDMKARTAWVTASQAKGKRGIPVALNGDAMAVLRRRAGDDETHVFTWRKKPIDSVVTRAWRNACAAAGFPGLRFHDLRHTWASWQAQGGTPLYALREMGGWASDAMVKRYAHLSAGHLAEFADRSLLRPKVGTGQRAAKKK